MQRRFTTLAPRLAAIRVRHEDADAADLVLVPLTIGFGAANAIEAAAGTLINLVDLIPGI